MALRVGGVATKGALAGHLLALDVLGDGLGLVKRVDGSGLDALLRLLNLLVGCDGGLLGLVAVVLLR